MERVIGQAHHFRMPGEPGHIAGRADDLSDAHIVVAIREREQPGRNRPERHKIITSASHLAGDLLGRNARNARTGARMGTKLDAERREPSKRRRGRALIAAAYCCPTRSGRCNLEVTIGHWPAALGDSRTRRRLVTAGRPRPKPRT